MNSSQLIVYTLKEPLFCCCFLHGSLMACSSNRALLLWDFAEGKKIAEYGFVQQVAPISITAVRADAQAATLLLQLKQTKTYIFTYDAKSNDILKVNEYQLDMIGFTKLPIARFVYGSTAKVERKIGDCFYTIRYSNTIERRETLSGKMMQQIEVEETTFEEVNFLLTYSIEDATYFLVVQEGATFKQFVLNQSSQLVEVNKILKLKCKSQIGIVLSVEPISDYRAYLCIRDGFIYLINLKTVQLETQINIQFYRIIKSIPHAQEKHAYAISSMNQLSILKDNTIRCRQKMSSKSFILDMDTLDLGVIAVTEQGKILFLPLL